MEGDKCKECDQGRMVLRSGKSGKFLGCNAYPDCKHTETVGDKEAKPQFSDKDKYIIREVSLKAAVEYNGDLTDKQSFNGILNIAEHFEKWVKR